MVDRNKYDILQSRSAAMILHSGCLLKRMKPVADTLADLGAKIILLKCGVAGMYLHTAARLLCLMWNKISPDMDEWEQQEDIRAWLQTERSFRQQGRGTQA